MPGVHTLEWKDGHRETLYGARGYYYVLPSDKLLSFLPLPAWCHDCGTIRLCEEFDEPDIIRQELADLEIADSETAKAIAKFGRPEFIETWKRKREIDLQHSQARRLPPSCLSCGNRNVSYFVADKWAPHPGTGEEVRFTLSGMCSTGFERNFYDVDGRPLELSEEHRTRLIDLIRKSLDF